MGHYDDCYDREYEEIQKWREEEVKNKTKKIKEEIEKYGLAEYLARKEVYK